MKKCRTKFSRYILSIILLIPAQIFTQFFVYFFASITGQLIAGYAIGCGLFGFLVSLPILRQPFRKGKSRTYQIITGLLLVLTMAGILFASMLSPNFS